jgi:hypothetical protein
MSKSSIWSLRSRFIPFRGLPPIFAPQSAGSTESALPAKAAVAGRPGRTSALRLPRPRIVIAGAIALLAGLVWMEIRTSALQAQVFSRYASGLTWEVRNGACETPLGALDGPYDRRLGYQQLGELSSQLTARDFRISRQACPSPELAKLVARGVAPPYDEKHLAALQILDRDGKDLYHAPLDQFAFSEYGQIPALLVQSLLFVENRQLLDQDRTTLNPAVQHARDADREVPAFPQRPHRGRRRQGAADFRRQLAGVSQRTGHPRSAPRHRHGLSEQHAAGCCTGRG